MWGMCVWGNRSRQLRAKGTFARSVDACPKGRKPICAAAANQHRARGDREQHRWGKEHAGTPVPRLTPVTGLVCKRRRESRRASSAHTRPVTQGTPLRETTGVLCEAINTHACSEHNENRALASGATAPST